jgi:isopenicillin-N epimerase
MEQQSIVNRAVCVSSAVAACDRRAGATRGRVKLGTRPVVDWRSVRRLGPYGRHMLYRWQLERGWLFLNHGSMGATPRTVLGAQHQWRKRMERQPDRFMTKELPAALRAAAGELAEFMGTAGDNLVFVENTSAAINAVLRSRRWEKGDEMLVTNHGYRGVRQAAEFVARQSGAILAEARVPFPLASADEVVAAVEAELRPGTRLAILDHVASPTALVFPVERLVQSCHARGVAVLIDGAHAPGMLPLDLDRLGADYYAGNCYKWLFAPKGCGFLWARPERQAELHAPVISWSAPDGYPARFDWAGARDPSPWLAVPAAIAFWRRLGGEALQRHNCGLVREAAQLLLGAWGMEPPAPSGMLGAMATLPLPGRWSGTRPEAETLHDELAAQGIEAQITAFADRLWVRLSAQAYNVLDDYEVLRAALDRRTQA